MKIKRLFLLVMSICLLLVGFNTKSIKAEEGDLRSRLNERQLYVYDLVQAFSDPKTSMLRVVQAKDNYFQIMDIDGIFDILSFNHLGEALFGSDSYSQSYLNTVIADTLSAIECDYDEDLMDSADRVNDIVSTESGLLENSPKYLGLVSNIIKGASIIHEGKVYLTKVAYASDLTLNALALVANETDNENVSFCAKKAYVLACSDDGKGQFLYWGELAGKKSLSELIGTLTGPIQLGALGLDIIAGKVVEKNICELHATEFQSAIFNTFFKKLFSKGNNYLINDYTDKELEDLKSLTALYLKAGYNGFSYNEREKNKEKCKKMLNKVMNMTIPVSQEQYQGSHVTLTDYSVPGQLAVGDKYSFFGTVNSSEPLRKVTVEIYSDSQRYRYESNELQGNSYSLYNLDNAITVNKMPSGSYHYVVYATCDSGTYVVLDRSFEIVEEDGNMTINQYRIPGVIKKGNYFVVTGLVKSSSPLSKVIVEITRPDGTRVTGDEAISINSTEYDLHRLDANTRFDLLTAGRYRYRIIGTNERGSEVLVDQPIIVIE